MNPLDAAPGAAGGPLPIVRDREGPIFNEAWEAEAFAMVVALREAKLFGWSEWTAALERIVVDKGAASRAALASRKEAWARAAEATPHGRPILLANDPQSEGSP